MKIIPLVEHNNNAKSIGVVDTLKDALKDVETGKRVATHCAIIFLDAATEDYYVGFQQCGMKMSELVALLEITKQDIIHNEMRVGRNLK